MDVSEETAADDLAADAEYRGSSYYIYKINTSINVSG